MGCFLFVLAPCKTKQTNTKIGMRRSQLRKENGLINIKLADLHPLKGIRPTWNEFYQTLKKRHAILKTAKG